MQEKDVRNPIQSLFQPSSRFTQQERALTPRPHPWTVQRDGCPKIVNLGSAKTDLFYERKKCVAPTPPAPLLARGSLCPVGASDDPRPLIRARYGFKKR